MPSRSRVSRWADILSSHSCVRLILWSRERKDIQEGGVPVIIAYESETVAGPYDQDAG